MSSSKTKGKQISVIVAGATGSTGRHVVSRLVSHPDVSRVVALVRHPVPVNRWTTVFPQLNTSDALRCLSVVPLDWEKMINDVSKVPLSYVAEGVWDYNSELGLRSAAHRHLTWHQYQQLRKLRSGADPSVVGAPAAPHRPTLFRSLFGSPLSSSSSHGARKGGGSSGAHGHGRGHDVGQHKRVGYVQFTHYTSPTSAAGSDAKRGDEEEDNVESDIMTVGTGKLGILGLHMTAPGSSRTASSSSSSAGTASTNLWSSVIDDPFYGPMSEEERIRYGKTFLQQMLQTPFYQTVFTGHHVAINCIGTSHWLSSRYLAAVDYDLSIAFAKAVRIFNCMTHAEVNEVEDEMLVEQANHAMDSVLWREIYTACYGKKIESATMADVASGMAATTATAPTSGVDPASDPSAATPLTAETLAVPLDDLPGDTAQPSASVDFSSDVMGDLKAVPDPLNPASAVIVNAVPELSFMAPESSAVVGAGINSGDKDFLMNLTTYGAVATLRHFTQMSVRAANPNSLIPYLYVHGQRDKELLFMFNQTTPKSKRRSILQPLFSFIDPLFQREVGDLTRGGKAVEARKRGPWAETLFTILYGPGSASAIYRQRKLKEEEEEAAGLSDTEKVAMERLQLLLRRDRVKVWDLADLSIWRPGVFHHRTRQRWIEKLFTLVERPVDVNLLAECVVDDITEAINRERVPGAAHKGTVKVISGVSVSRRVHMKAIEDGLDERDSQHGPSLYSEPLLRLPLRLVLLGLVLVGFWFMYIAYRVAVNN